MTLQDQIDSFQKLIFSYFRSGANNECRISALVGLVQESYGIYKFITSMLRAMHISTYIYNLADALLTSQRLAMTKHCPPFAAATTPSIIGSSNSTTSAPTCATSRA